MVAVIIELKILTMPRFFCGFDSLPNKQNTGNVNIGTGFSYSNIKYFKFSSITVDHLVLMNCLSSYFHIARAKEWAKASVTYCESGAGTDLPWEEARRAWSPPTYVSHPSTLTVSMFPTIRFYAWTKKLQNKKKMITSSVWRIKDDLDHLLHIFYHPFPHSSLDYKF